MNKNVSMLYRYSHDRVGVHPAHRKVPETPADTVSTFSRMKYKSDIDTNILKYLMKSAVLYNMIIL
jgi:hypothetical protein